MGKEIFRPRLSGRKVEKGNGRYVMIRAHLLFALLAELRSILRDGLRSIVPHPVPEAEALDRGILIARRRTRDDVGGTG